MPERDMQLSFKYGTFGQLTPIVQKTVSQSPLVFSPTTSRSNHKSDFIETRRNPNRVQQSLEDPKARKLTENGSEALFVLKVPRRSGKGSTGADPVCLCCCFARPEPRETCILACWSSQRSSVVSNVKASAFSTKSLVSSHLSTPSR